MRDLEKEVRKAFGLIPAKSNFLIVVQAYYRALSVQGDHARAYEAALSAYCRSNDASRGDRTTRTMVGVLIAEAGLRRGRSPWDRRKRR